MSVKLQKSTYFLFIRLAASLFQYEWRVLLVNF